MEEEKDVDLNFKSKSKMWNYTYIGIGIVVLIFIFYFIGSMVRNNSKKEELKTKKINNLNTRLSYIESFLQFGGNKLNYVNEEDESRDSYTSSPPSLNTRIQRTSMQLPPKKVINKDNKEYDEIWNNPEERKGTKQPLNNRQDEFESMPVPFRRNM